ncbi:MAG: hypothetical protein R3A43_01945 [Bacteroidia bacterium]
MTHNSATFPTVLDTVFKTSRLRGVYNGNMHNMVLELGIYGCYKQP